MDEEQEELSTHEASQQSGMSQGHLASLLRQHKLAGSFNSKQRRWMVNAAALERYLTIDDRTGERRFTYANRLYERAQQSVDEGHLAQAEPLYQRALWIREQGLSSGPVTLRVSAFATSSDISIASSSAIRKRKRFSYRRWRTRGV